MAKSKSFFGLRRGSTKSHTFQVLQGVQITKDRVENVANPQSAAQMLQRVVFATVTQAADKMLPIIGISQQGITNETESRRRWISQNVKKLRDAARRMQQGGAVEAAFAPKGNTQLIPNSYQMSKGSLAIVPALVPSTSADDGKSFGQSGFDYIGTLGRIPYGSYTPLQLWSLLFGLDPGDQLTFPQIYGEGFAQTLTGAGGVVVDKTIFTDFCAPRLVLKLTHPDAEPITINANTDLATFKQIMATAVSADDSWYDPIDITSNITFEAVAGENALEFSINQLYDTVFAINNDDPLRAIGCIRSHKDENRKWQYSTCELVCVWADDDKSSGTSDYFGFTLANAIDTYKKNVILDSDGNFLQRGTDDNIVPPSFQ